KAVQREDESSRILMNEAGLFEDFVTAKKYREVREDGGYAFTGLYSLTKEIFDHPLVKLKTRDEWGLPQTLVNMKDTIDLTILETDFWIPISTPQDLEK